MPSEEQQREVVTFRAERWMIDAIDQFAADEGLHLDGPMTREEAITLMLEDWLVAHACVPISENEEDYEPT